MMPAALIADGSALLVDLAGRAAGAAVIALRTTRSDEELREAHAIADNLASLSKTPDTQTPTKVQTLT